MRLLVIRTSAMGDVALTVPVIAAVASQYPGTEIILLTREAFRPFFNSIPGIKFFHPEFKNRHKGLAGLQRLKKDILKFSGIDQVIDLHDVLRSKVLRQLFRLSGTPVSVIDKGRSEKKDLISGKEKVFLKHSVERYCDVFAAAGYPVEPLRENSIIPTHEALVKAGMIIDRKSVLNIGVAPYAKHKLKSWPEEYMVKLLNMISTGHSCRFWLFGGKEDLQAMDNFCTKIPDAYNIISNLTLDEQLALMSRLDVMISMDSSNMHMAALVGTRVISIWGGTDPMAGFSPWMQPDSYSIRIPVEELDCRPCTIYGKGETRNNHRCMLELTPERVYERMQALEVFS
jgi:ADP-heptose:LPS heptosyltransferase